MAPLLSSLMGFHHFDCVLHERRDLLLKALFLVRSDSCGLEVFCELNQAIVASHYFFLRRCGVSFIVFEVLLPLRVVIGLLENAIVTCPQAIVHHFIEILENRNKVANLLVLVEPSLIIFLLKLLDLLLIRFSDRSLV